MVEITDIERDTLLNLKFLPYKPILSCTNITL